MNKAARVEPAVSMITLRDTSAWLDYRNGDAVMVMNINPPPFDQPEKMVIRHDMLEDDVVQGFLPVTDHGTWHAIFRGTSVGSLN